MSNPASASARYTPEGVASLAACFHQIPELSLEQRNTAARAILWANKSEDNTCTTCKDGGLDLLYIDLHSLGEAWDDEAKQISNLQDRTMKDVLDVVCFHLPSLPTHCIIITGRSLFLSMPIAGLCCSYMLWVQNQSTQVMQTLQSMYTSCLLSTWATKSSLPMSYTLWINTKIVQPHLDHFLLRCQYNAVTLPLWKGVYAHAFTYYHCIYHISQFMVNQFP